MSEYNTPRMKSYYELFNVINMKKKNQMKDKDNDLCVRRWQHQSTSIQFLEHNKLHLRMESNQTKQGIANSFGFSGCLFF